MAWSLARVETGVGLCHVARRGYGVDLKLNKRPPEPAHEHVLQGNVHLS
jgi:hypothetical protein